MRDQEFYMCFKFDKGNNTVCILSSEEISATITDSANFALILVVNYMDWMYKNRRLRVQLPQTDQRFLTEKNSLYLGSEFSIKAGQTGIPVLISNSSIKIAYKYNQKLENYIELAKIFHQELENQKLVTNNEEMEVEAEMK